MVKKKHNEDKKLHNSNEPDLSWQETVDIKPEDNVDGGSEIFYSVDEGGNIHSREFLLKNLLRTIMETYTTYRKENLAQRKSDRLQPAFCSAFSARNGAPYKTKHWHIGL